LVLDFGQVMDEATNKKVVQLFHYFKELAHPYILDLVPAYSSLGIYYDVLALRQQNPGTTAFEQMVQFIEKVTERFEVEDELPGRTLRVPVCYDAPYAMDLAAMAADKKTTQEELVARHTALTYRVYMTGFLPGFAYMGTVDDVLATPRRSEPRQEVPAGSVGIAGRQTGIYPMDSPAGWSIIGRTPLSIFNKDQEQPVLLQPGDSIQFYSITADEFAHYQSRTA
jgi:inhibitor of KinA